MVNFVAYLELYPLLLAGFIVVARIIDVSLGTVRTICVVRGYPTVAALLGYFEVVIWILAVSGVLQQITVMKVVAYGAGFALGNVGGIFLEKRLAMGQQMITLMSRGRTHTVAFALRLANFGVTEIPARGGRGHVAMAYVLTSRRKTPEVLRIARAADPKVVTVVEDIRESNLAHVNPPMPRTGWRAKIKKK